MIVSYCPTGKMAKFFETTDKFTTPPTKEEVAKVFQDHDMISRRLHLRWQLQAFIGAAVCHGESY